MVHTRPSRSIRSEAKSLSRQHAPRPPRQPVPPGPKRKPRNRLEAILSATEASISTNRRKISRKDRLFVDLYLQSDCTEPEKAATEAGFVEPGIGFKLVGRLSDLIQAERSRRTMRDQMELDEALRVLAEIARDDADRKVQHAAVRTVLQVHGALADKPLPPSDRRSLAREIEAMAGTLGMAVQRAGGKARIQAAIAIQAEISPDRPEQAENAEILEIEPSEPKTP